MERIIDHHLQEWYKQKDFRPLILRGARQVGKTYAVRQLAKKFDNFIELNLEFSPKIRRLFEEDLDPVRIVNEISYSTNKKVTPGKTLLFFDELQAAPQALQALRYFYEMMPELHVIAAGSLLDFAIEEVGVPVGRVEFLYMYPLSFLEFIRAQQEDILIDAIMKHSVDTPISSIAHDRLLKLVGEYLAIGGMPSVVQSWIEEKKPEKCFRKQQSLIDSYRQDFNKYAKKSQLKYLEILFNDIPLQIGKKFKYSSVPGEFRKRELSPCLDLLVTAGIVHKVYHTDAQGLPLGAQVNPEEFKLVFLDVAVTQAILGFNPTDWLSIDSEQQFVNKGEIVEAFVGQELLAYSDPVQKKQLYYWLRSERTANAEVDYVVAVKRAIIPIEVKSGAGSTLRSMHVFFEKHAHSPHGIRFSRQNYSVYENIHSYPLYAVLPAINYQQK